MPITLPEDNGTVFNENQLVAYLHTMGRSYIIQGQQQVALLNHTKDLSLDYWLRTQVATNSDTAQATNDVIAQLCATGLFVQNKSLICPNSGELCKGIELV